VDGFYRVVAILGAFVMIAGVLLTIVQLRGERPFSSLSVLLAGAGAGGSLAVCILVLDITLEKVAVVLLLAGGALLGAFVGTKIPLFNRGGVVLSKAAGWHTAPAGLAIAAFEIAGVKESADGVVLSLAALYAATAFAIAACVLLLLRRARLAGGQPMETQAQVVREN
jgi:hypothetical protein